MSASYQCGHKLLCTQLALRIDCQKMFGGIVAFSVRWWWNAVLREHRVMVGALCSVLIPFSLQEDLLLFFQAHGSIENLLWHALAVGALIM